MLTRRALAKLALGLVAATTARHAQAQDSGSAPADYPDLPEGYRKPGSMKWGWGPKDDGILPTWKGGSGTQFDPKFIEWNSDKSATLGFDKVGGTWTAGELQVTRPKRPVSERWGGMLSSDKPTAVCALFAYADDGTEIDFEWRGDNVWQLTLHLFDANGKRVNPDPIPTVAVDITRPHRYEFSLDDEACIWFVDGEEVARVTPDDMPGGIWKADAKLALFASIEHHGSWAKHDYSDMPASMTVYGLLV